MSSRYERFWDHESFAVVGDEAARNFPLLTYRGLKQLGKKVLAVDPTATQIDGDPAYRDLRQLPHEVQAVVLEVPEKHTGDWVRQAAAAGIRDVWIHMGRETPEALSLAEQLGLNVCTGHCAVMYVTPGFTYHSIHKWLVQLAGKY